MNQERLVELARKLEQCVENALQAGYESADCVITEEVADLLPRIYAGEITEPVKLNQTEFPCQVFEGTDLCHCETLEDTWMEFCMELQGHRQVVENYYQEMKAYAS